MLEEIDNKLVAQLEELENKVKELRMFEEQFDELKEFEVSKALNQFDVKTANTCETFVNKLPVFDLKTSRR